MTPRPGQNIANCCNQVAPLQEQNQLFMPKIYDVGSIREIYLVGSRLQTAHLMIQSLIMQWPGLRQTQLMTRNSPPTTRVIGGRRVFRVCW
jgi:hypothetical protein